MQQFSNYYLLSLPNADSAEATPLSIQGGTLDAINSSYNWQIQGGFDPQSYVKATRTGRYTYKSIETGKVYESCIGAYTEDAYKELLNGWSSV